MPSHYLDDPAPGARPLRPLGPSDPQLIGPYRLLGVLGTGGMGRVYLGHSQTGKRVAIKVIRGELAEDPAFRQRFAREVAIARTVSALYTAPVVDFDPDADPPWFATTYIEGPSLASLVRNHGPLAPQTVFTLAAGLAEALAGLHQAGFAHRDLKPANVLL
ncbi:MAG TPA: protein kinase, partial [Micromonosporaceae bacterium]